MAAVFGLDPTCLKNASKVIDIRREIEAAVPYPSRLRTSSGKPEATTAAAAHNSDE